MGSIRRQVGSGLAALLLAGCFGSSDFGVAGSEGEDGQLPGLPGLPGSPGNGGGSPGDVAAEEGAAFVMKKEQVNLLPFRIRLAKVAAVLGVTEDHAALSALRDARYDLGDHDFATGLVPDRSWTASRVALWVKSLKPVCAAPEFQARYPSLPDSLDALYVQAYGRHATPEDRAALDESLAGLELDAASKQEALCLSVLTATEFVSR